MCENFKVLKVLPISGCIHKEKNMGQEATKKDQGERNEKRAQQTRVENKRTQISNGVKGLPFTVRPVKS